MHTYFAVRGNLEALRGKKGWGKVERKGFEKKKKRIRQPSARKSEY
jgi:hypothetical protein